MPKIKIGQFREFRSRRADGAVTADQLQFPFVTSHDYHFFKHFPPSQYFNIMLGNQFDFVGI